MTLRVLIPLLSFSDRIARDFNVNLSEASGYAALAVTPAVR